MWGVSRLRSMCAMMLLAQWARWGRLPIHDIALERRSAALRRLVGRSSLFSAPLLGSVCPSAFAIKSHGSRMDRRFGRALQTELLECFLSPPVSVRLQA